jgi:hypothetical protein
MFKIVGCVQEERMLWPLICHLKMAEVLGPLTVVLIRNAAAGQADSAEQLVGFGRNGA